MNTRKTYFSEYNLGTQLLFILFTAVVGGIFIDSGGFVVSKIFDGPFFLDGYGNLGRYTLNLFDGNAGFPENNFKDLPVMKGEMTLGLLMHLGVCIMDTLFYFFITFSILKSTPKLLPAVILLICFLFMPYCIMDPAVGAGFFGSRTENQFLTLFKSAMLHPFFGVGIWYGANLFDKIYASVKHKNNPAM
ncbi:MAG: hypothetical protein CMF58_01930 [Lentimicrobiaceae bacterium]|jgi:hypothetical protein|nr:hypothetical protein [Lentimicrobiaceae bacterium]MDG2081831.1 DUF2938 family protein [Bacteroidales bacterium]|tara:strand:- start:333 stop:902 length:570 start_codon:yes stop_codon:yes gene_type:complete